MLDKIRLHEKGLLPVAYHKNLGIEYDARCVRLLGVTYAEVKVFTINEHSDEEVLAWCFTHGRRPSEEEILIWSDFLRKRGWRDDIHEHVLRQIKEGGLEQHSARIKTVFDLLDVEENRTPPDFTAWESKHF